LLRERGVTERESSVMATERGSRSESSEEAVVAGDEVKDGNGDH
jgi:hypothetical protein